MRARVNYLLGWLAWNWHCHVVAARFHKGRSSVYSDRPTWFVRDSAHLLHLARNTSADLAPLIQQASDEWNRRLERWKLSQGR